MPTTYDENSAVRMKDLQRGLVAAAMNGGGMDTSTFVSLSDHATLEAKVDAINMDELAPLIKQAKITYDKADIINWKQNGSNLSVTGSKAKFGGSSIHFDGTSWLYNVDAIELGGQDFTVDVWAYPTEGSSHNRIIDFQRSGGTYSDGLLLYALNNVFYLQGVMTSAVAISPRTDGKDRGGATHRHQGNNRPSDSPGFEGEGQDTSGSHRSCQSGGGQMNPYEALANAIILQAKDYRASWK